MRAGSARPADGRTWRRERGPRVSQLRGPLGARGGGSGIGHGLPRRHRGQRGPARNGTGPRRLDQLAAVDPQRLPADARLVDPARRLARRPLRAPARVRHRGRAVHRRVGAVRGGADGRAADRRQAVAGGRRGAAHARQPGDDRVELPPDRSRAGDRRLVRARRRGDGARPVAGRLSGRGGLVARDLHHQRAARDRRRSLGRPPRPRDPRPDSRRPPRLSRRNPGRARARPGPPTR